MKTKKMLIFLMLSLTVSAMIFQGCKKDDDPVDMTLATLLAGTIDLNGATSPNTVPVEPTIVATFSADV
ncbi:MAG: hypothetical protein Q7V19_16625, partial [Bacteroidales bacterium]|nr:hypothetical protein [Bacteroidales bacterium]